MVKDIVGRRFGRWSVLSRAKNNAGGTACWLCRCSCGTERIVRGTELRYGASQSCGCLNREISRGVCIERNTTHNLSKTREYLVWKKMRDRCNSPDRKDYPRYGGRGISVCERWSNFENFYADMGRCPPGLTIERLNNNGNYEPGNCRWASRTEQANNTRKNRPLTFNGRTLNLSQWAREIGITPMTLWKRLKRGWSVKRALTTGRIQ